MTVLRQQLHEAVDGVLDLYDGPEDDEHGWDSPLAAVPREFATADHPVWREIEPTSERGGFRFEEFNNPFQMDVAFLRWIWRVRQRAGVAMRPTSDARDPDGSVGAEKSAHKKRPCRAMDFQVANSYQRARVVVAAIREGCVRIGVYPGKAGDGGGLHLDAEDHDDNPSPRIWTRY